MPENGLLLDSSKTVLVSVSVSREALDNSNNALLEIVKCEPKSTFADLKQYITHKYPELGGRGFSVHQTQHDRSIGSEVIPLDKEKYFTVDQFVSRARGNFLQVDFVKQNSVYQEEQDSTDFDNGNHCISIHTEMNVLSVQKRIKIPCWEDVSISKVTLSHLLEKCLKYMNDYEKLNNGAHSGNFCVFGMHSIDDIISVNFNGKSYTKEQVIELEKTSLQDVIGYDVIPSGRNVCLMLYINHNQGSVGQAEQAQDEQVLEKRVLEFISESELITQEMSINADDTITTVHDVKEYICSVYAHATRINTKDVKLIFQGHILMDNHLPIMSFFKLDNGFRNRLKMHVVINTDSFFRYNEDEPGFWTELFHNPNRFVFMNRVTPQPENATGSAPFSATNITTTASNTIQNRLSLNHAMTGVSMSRAGSHAQSRVSIDHKINTPDSEKDREYKLYDSVGNLIEQVSISNSYSKIAIKNKEYLVPSTVLDEPFDYFLEFEPGSVVGNIAQFEQQHVENTEQSVSVKIPRESFIVRNNVILLDADFVQELGAKFETSLLSSTFYTGSNINGHTSGIPHGSRTGSNIMTESIVIIPENPFIEIFKQVLFLLCRSVYLIIRSSILGIIILLQVSTFLPLNYTLILIGLNFAGNFWVCTELWDLWTDYFHLQRLSDYDYNNIYKDIILKDDIEVTLLIEWKDNFIVRKLLFQGIQNDIISMNLDILRNWQEFGLTFNIDENGNVSAPELDLGHTMDVVFNTLKFKPDLKHTREYKKLISPLIDYFKTNLNSWKITGFQQTVHSEFLETSAFNANMNSNSASSSNEELLLEEIELSDQEREAELLEIKELKKLINVLRNHFRQKTMYRRFISRTVLFFNSDLVMLAIPSLTDASVHDRVIINNNNNQNHGFAGTAVRAVYKTLLSAVQTVLLFFLIFIPHFQRIFERKMNEREQHEEELARQGELQEDELQEEELYENEQQEETHEIVEDEEEDLIIEVVDEFDVNDNINDNTNNNANANTTGFNR